MALDQTVLKTQINNELTARGLSPLNPATGGEAERYIEALAVAIVNHIKADAEVPVTGGSSAGVYKVQ